MRHGDKELKRASRSRTSDENAVKICKELKGLGIWLILTQTQKLQLAQFLILCVRFRFRHFFVIVTTISKHTQRARKEEQRYSSLVLVWKGKFFTIRKNGRERERNPCVLQLAPPEESIQWVSIVCWLVWNRRHTQTRPDRAGRERVTCSADIAISLDSLSPF